MACKLTVAICSDSIVTHYTHRSYINFVTKSISKIVAHWSNSVWHFGAIWEKIQLIDHNDHICPLHCSNLDQLFMWTLYVGPMIWVGLVVLLNTCKCLWGEQWHLLTHFQDSHHHVGVTKESKFRIFLIILVIQI